MQVSDWQEWLFSKVGKTTFPVEENRVALGMLPKLGNKYRNLIFEQWKNSSNQQPKGLKPKL